MSGGLLVATGYLLVEMLLVVLLMRKQAYLLAVEAVEQSSWISA